MAVSQISHAELCLTEMPNLVLPPLPPFRCVWGVSDRSFRLLVLRHFPSNIAFHGTCMDLDLHTDTIALRLRLRIHGGVSVGGSPSTSRFLQ